METITVTQVEDVMVLAHDNGCIEVLTTDLTAFEFVATCELNWYIAQGVENITHNACEFSCAKS